MKVCPKCHEEVEDGFEAYWNCNYGFPDDKILDMTPAGESNGSGRSTDCLCYQVRMVYSGKHELHKGMNTSIFGNLSELFQNREAFGLYVYLEYGKAELLVPLDRKREFKVG